MLLIFSPGCYFPIINLINNWSLIATSADALSVTAVMLGIIFSQGPMQGLEKGGGDHVKVKVIILI